MTEFLIHLVGRGYVSSPSYFRNNFLMTYRFIIIFLHSITTNRNFRRLLFFHPKMLAMDFLDTLILLLNFP